MKQQQNNPKNKNDVEMTSASKPNFWMAMSLILFLFLIGGIIFLFLPNETDDSPEPEIVEVSFTDEEIENAINEQLVWDNRVDSTDVNVEVTDGQVTLLGTVSSYTAQKAAGQNALDIGGVISVDNKLVVEDLDVTDLPDDNTLEERVNNSLLWSPDLDSVDIEVSASLGNITLEGSVDALWKKTRAEVLAYNVTGVKNVNNELAIVYTEDFTDERIAEDITNAVDRNVFLDEEDIEVFVDEGHVTLTGKVNSIQELEELTDIAFYTQGVLSVQNEATVGD